MCGIIGVFNRKNHKELVEKGLEIIKYRGLDGKKVYSNINYSIGHLLHSIVGFVEQPIKNRFVANCEIYNWEELNRKYNLKAKNDAELLFYFVDKGLDLDELDGSYAFALIKDDKVILARDILGIKPLWYTNKDGFVFASEKKVFKEMIELNPRKILVYENNKIRFIQREFFKLNLIKGKNKEKVKELLFEAVKKRIPKKKLGLLFSGGIDSTILAVILKEFNVDFTCYVSGFYSENIKEAEDVIFAKKVAKELNLDLKVIEIKDIKPYLEKIIPLIEDTNVTKVGVALPFFVACEQARKDGCKVIFSGLGSEEIFAGYERHKNSNDINKECLSGLLKMYERGLYRDDVITMYNNLELRLPFLDKKLIEFVLNIDGKYKINEKNNKLILREIGKDLGLKKEIYNRKKRAAQYGSNFHKALKKSGKRDISGYLKKYYSYNLRLGALVSGGKDSIYAMYVMMKQNYKIECLVTIKSKNKDSFMYHTPTIDLVRLQADSLGIPLIIQETWGEKEKELEDLKIVLKLAKKKYHIDGVVHGGLFSDYQRKRIEEICDSLGLKIFSPLWHMDQEKEIREVIRNGFEFIITKVACDGLDKSWLGRIITEKDVDKLVKIKGINVAFEGGEAETLVVNCPIFSKKIDIKDYEIKCEKLYNAHIFIKKAMLN